MGWQQSWASRQANANTQIAYQVVKNSDVAINNGLAMNPDIMLFDEPTSALDLDSWRRTKRYEELAEQGMTMIIVTHEMGFARRFINRVIFTADGGS